MSFLLSIHRWSITSAQVISLCPNLECTSMVWVSVTHTLSMANFPCVSYSRSAFRLRNLSLAEMMFHAVVRSFSPPSAAHVLLVWYCMVHGVSRSLYLIHTCHIVTKSHICHWGTYFFTYSPHICSGPVEVPSRACAVL